jgi:hypothetical protein
MSSHAADIQLSATIDNVATLDKGVPARWLMLLGVPFVVGGALFGLGISTGEMWLLAPASVFGPGAMILGFTYLGISADTNRYS